MSTESTRREFLKLSTAGLAAGAVAKSVPAWASVSPANPGQISVRVTDENRRFENGSALSWRQAAGQPSADIIVLNPAKSSRKFSVSARPSPMQPATCLINCPRIREGVVP